LILKTSVADCPPNSLFFNSSALPRRPKATSKISTAVRITINYALANVFNQFEAIDLILDCRLSNTWALTNIRRTGIAPW
jgi:hypothetical protein